MCRDCKNSGKLKGENIQNILKLSLHLNTPGLLKVDSITMKKSAFIFLFIVVVLMRTSAIPLGKDTDDQPRLMKRHIIVATPGLEGNKGSLFLLIKRAADENKNHPRLRCSPDCDFKTHQ
ncbi:hypothetical protein ACOMHN_029371 [Nucella lapillus]